MFQVTKEFEFCAAHRLLKHNGKCKHLHGHNYKAIVTFQNKGLNRQDMVVDFQEIKDKVGEWIKQNWDHTSILNQDDANLIDLLRSGGDHPYVVGCDPTAEALAMRLWEVCAEILPYPLITQVVIYETESCCASYS